MMIEKKYKFALFLVIATISMILIHGVFAQGQWVSIDDVIVNGGQSTEVGIAQDLTIDILISVDPIPSPTNAVIGIDIYNSGGYVASFTNQTSLLVQLTNYTFNFEKTIILLATGDYTARAFVQYDKNGTNETIYSNASFRVVSLTPVSLTAAHGDAAFGDTVNFLQGIQNNGNESANATVKVWIWYDFNNNSIRGDAGDSLYGTEPPTKDEIPGSTLKEISVLWAATPSELADCKYTNASLRSIYSTWSYGSTGVRSWTGFYLTNFNITYVKVDTDCQDYCHSGLYQTEIAPGGVITGSVELLNQGANATIIHEVTAWIEDQDGTKWLTLGASDSSLQRDSYPQYYKDNLLPGHNATCDDLSNTTIAHQGSLDFSFQGVLPANLPTNNTYKVVYAIDYGVPRADMVGQPYNILQPYNFKLVSAKVLDIETPLEVTYSVAHNINTSIKNIGVTSIDDLSVYVDIYNSSGYNIENFTGSYTDTPAGSYINSSNLWNIPYIGLGNYYINATVTFGNGGTSSLSVPFEIVYIATLFNNIIADPIVPYETENILIPVQNQGPTNATMKSIRAKINTPTPISLGTFIDTEIPNNSIYSFNFTYSFDPSGLTNGSFELEIDEEFGERSFSYSPVNITLLPVGIKSFTVPSTGINTSSVPISVTLTNIGNSGVSVFLNLTDNGTTINQTTVTAASNSNTTVDFNINITLTGTHNITITANYSGLPQPIVRSDTIQIYTTSFAPDLSVVSISPSPSSPTTNQNVSITATVNNSGNLSANNVTVEFILDNVSQANNTIDVASSSSNSTVFYWNATLGTHNITIVADPDNSISEADETNNNATVSITVTAPSPPSSGDGGGGGGGGSPSYDVHPCVKNLGKKDLKEKQIAELAYECGHSRSPAKYIISPLYASLAGVFASQDEVVLSPELSDRLFESHPSSKQGRIIKKEPTILGEDIYKVAADYVLETTIRANKIVIARGDLGADSITASTFANLIGAKILLVKPDEVPYPTQDVLDKYRPNTVYIIGGEDAVSPEVANTVGKYAYKVERISGDTRYETSLEIARRIMEMSDPSVVVVTDGKEPVTYAASLAVKLNAPLVYMDENSPEEVFQFIGENDFRIVARLYQE